MGGVTILGCGHRSECGCCTRWVGSLYLGVVTVVSVGVVLDGSGHYTYLVGVVIVRGGCGHNTQWMELLYSVGELIVLCPHP